MSNYETRSIAELRATEGKLAGYFVVFNSLSEDLGGFRELIRPGAFDRTLRERPDVLALAEHDKAKVLGRTTNGTLRITSDARGMQFEIDPPATSYANDLLTLVRRGDVYNASFRFRPYPDGDEIDFETMIRTLSSVELVEISIVSMPAYPATEASVRHAQHEVSEWIAHKQRTARLKLSEHY